MFSNFSKPPRYMKISKDPNDDPRPTSLLSYWITHSYFESPKHPFDHSQFMTMVSYLKPIDELYRIVDGDPSLTKKITHAILTRVYKAVSTYPILPIVVFRNLAQHKCFKEHTESSESSESSDKQDAKWSYVIKHKVKVLVKKLEDRYLPKGVELLPRRRYGKYDRLNEPKYLDHYLPPRRFGVYYRVSTDNQELESQKFEVEKYINSLPEDQKPSSVTVYEDKGISGSKDDRPAFQKLLSDAYKGLIDTVVVYRLDRFSRSSSTAIRMLLDFEDQGTKFISVTQPILSSDDKNPFRKTLLAAFSELAQIEREAIVMRVKAGLASARARGKILGRAATYTPEQKAQCLELRAQGKKMREISEILGVHISWVKRIISLDRQGKDIRQKDLE